MRRTQDTKLIAEAHAYVAKLYREVMVWTVADLGTQNQVCDFILAYPELCRALRAGPRMNKSARPAPSPEGCYRRTPSTIVCDPASPRSSNRHPCRASRAVKAQRTKRKALPRSSKGREHAIS
jgi:hypothetical protein